MTPTEPTADLARTVQRAPLRRDYAAFNRKGRVMPEDPTDIAARLRGRIREALPLIGLAGFVALVLILIFTRTAASDAPTGELETRVYIERTFYVILTIGLLFAAYVASRGKQ